jgi:DNA repair protein SbcD/Mre11
MRASFVHIADTHLGYEQYGVRERFNDFSRAFWDIIDDAVARDIDFMVIAGDLFHKRAIDALTLIHAIEGLKKLKDRGIPVVAIEGNHDRSYYREGISWLQFLCHQGYLTLLNPRMQNGAPVITAWDEGTMSGSHVDLLGGRLRVYGLPWQGAATARSIEGMAQALEEARAAEEAAGVEYRLLMMHTGVDGVVPHIQGLPTMSQFQALHRSVDYLALGHVHKPFEFDGWIYNPGSTETVGADEAAWEDRGYYFVEVDTDSVGAANELESDDDALVSCHRALHLVSKRRPFVRYDVHVNGASEPQELYDMLERRCRFERPNFEGNTLRPLIKIHLVGTLTFDAGSLDIPYMQKMVHDLLNPLYADIENNTNDQDYIPENGEIDGRDRATWHELERHIFEDLVSRDNRFLVHREQWSHVLADLKRMALDEDDPAEIARFLREKRVELMGA